jgi:hypothetical protein
MREEYTSLSFNKAAAALSTANLLGDLQSVPANYGRRGPLHNDNALSDCKTSGFASLCNCGWVPVVLLNYDLLSGDGRCNRVLSERAQNGINACYFGRSFSLEPHRPDRDNPAKVWLRTGAGGRLRQLNSLWDLTGT